MLRNPMRHDWIEKGMEGNEPQVVGFVDLLVREAGSRGRVAGRLSAEGEITFDIGLEVLVVRPKAARGLLRSMCARLGILFEAPLYGATEVVKDLPSDGVVRKLRLSFANSNAAGVWFEIVCLNA